MSDSTLRPSAPQSTAKSTLNSIQPRSTGAPERASERYMIHFRSVGGAPALKQSKFPISGVRDITYIEANLKKMLGEDRSIFIYCGSGFAPNRDQKIEDLYNSFRTGDELTVFYGFQESWGWQLRESRWNRLLFSTGTVRLLWQVLTTIQHAVQALLFVRAMTKLRTVARLATSVARVSRVMGVDSYKERKWNRRSNGYYFQLILCMTSNNCYITRSTRYLISLQAWVASNLKTMCLPKYIYCTYLT